MELHDSTGYSPSEHTLTLSLYYKQNDPPLVSYLAAEVGAQSIKY
jgi:hypothetical protein